MPVDQVRQMFEQVTTMATGEGLAYDFDTVRPANTFDAHRLATSPRRRTPCARATSWRP